MERHKGIQEAYLLLVDCRRYLGCSHSFVVQKKDLLQLRFNETVAARDFTHWISVDVQAAQ